MRFGYSESGRIVGKVVTDCFISLVVDSMLKRKLTLILLFLSAPVCASNLYVFESGESLVTDVLTGTVLYRGSPTVGSSTNISVIKTSYTMCPPTTFELETDLAGAINFPGYRGVGDSGRIHLNLHPRDYYNYYDLDEYRLIGDASIVQERRWKDLSCSGSLKREKTSLGAVCGVTSRFMNSSATEDTVYTSMQLTATGEDVDQKQRKFRTTCTYKWKRAPLETAVQIKPEVVNLTGKVGERVLGNFDVILTAPFSNTPRPSLKWDLVEGGTPGCEVRLSGNYAGWNAGEWRDASYGTYRMTVAVTSNKPQVCTKKLNWTVQIM